MTDWLPNVSLPHAAVNWTKNFGALYTTDLHISSHLHGNRCCRSTQMTLVCWYMWRLSDKCEFLHCTRQCLNKHKRVRYTSLPSAIVKNSANFVLMYQRVSYALLPRLPVEVAKIRWVHTSSLFLSLSYLSLSPLFSLSLSLCSVFYSMVAFVLVPGLVGLLCTHVYACAAHALFHTLVFPLLFPFSLILQLQVHSQFPASCVSVFVPRTYTILATRIS